MTTRAPFAERGGALRGLLDLAAGRYPSFLFGASTGDLLPVFHFHEVTVADLEPKLAYLSENGYRTVTSDEIAAYARREAPLPGRRVALCFDDAWASLWTVAGPLLKKHGMTAITYAIPARMTDARECRTTIEHGPEPAIEGSAFVTWPELRALSTSGVVDVQCHTDSHSMVFCSNELRGFVTPEYVQTPFLNRPQLLPPPALRFVAAEELGAPLYAARSRMSDGLRTTMPIDRHERLVAYVAAEGGARFFERPDWQGDLMRRAGDAGQATVESDSDQRVAIETELDRCRSILTDRLGVRSVNHVCLPWGVSGRITSDALVRLGFRSAFANRMRGVHAVRPGDDPFWLRRLANRHIFRLPGRGRRLWG